MTGRPSSLNPMIRSTQILGAGRREAPKPHRNSRNNLPAGALSVKPLALHSYSTHQVRRAQHGTLAAGKLAPPPALSRDRAQPGWPACAGSLSDRTEYATKTCSSLHVLSCCEYAGWHTATSNNVAPGAASAGSCVALGRCVRAGGWCRSELKRRL